MHETFSAPRNLNRKFVKQKSEGRLENEGQDYACL